MHWEAKNSHLASFILFTAVAWSQTCSISEVCLYNRLGADEEWPLLHLDDMTHCQRCQTALEI